MPGVPCLVPTPPALFPNHLQLAESHLQPLHDSCRKRILFSSVAFPKASFQLTETSKALCFILFPWLNLEPYGVCLQQSIGLLSLAGSKSWGRRSTGAAPRLQDFHRSSKDLLLLQINILICHSKFSFLSLVANDLNLVPRDFRGHSVQRKTK